MIDLSSLISLFETEFEEIQKGVLTPQTDFKKVIRWDSMNSLIFIVVVQVNFGVLLKDEEILKLTTIIDLLNHINNCMDE